MMTARGGGRGRWGGSLGTLLVAAACNGGDGAGGDHDKDGGAGGNTGCGGSAEGCACSSDDPCGGALVCRAGLCVEENDPGVPSAGAAGAPSGGDPGSGGSAGDTGVDRELVYGVDKAATLARAGVSDPDALMPHDGNLIADIPGHTYRDLDVSGWVDIQADGVTLENVRIRVGSALRETWNPPTQAGIWNYGRPSTFRNVEIAPTHPSVDTYGILGSNYEAYDVSVRDCVDAIQVNTNTGPVRVYGGLLDRILWYADDPRQSDGSHSDAIQIIGGSGHLIQGTVVRVGAGPDARTQDAVHAGSFGIIISPGSIGPVTDVTVERVWFEGDGYSHFKLGQGGHGPVTPLRILECRFEQYTDNPVIHGSAASINVAEIVGNTGPGGVPLPANQIWADDD